MAKEQQFNSKDIYHRVLANPWNGMSDEELEFCAGDASEKNFSPGVFWTSEIYSLGYWIRQYAHYPKFLPLFLTSDHGTNLHSVYYDNEEKRPSNVHFTWHPRKEELAEFYKKRIVCIQHPYIHCIKKNNISPSNSRRGTLVFYSHHLPGFNLVKDIDCYFKELIELSGKNKPLVISLHMHDIKAENHLKLRKYGFPLITAGNTSSIHFAERLLKLISNFKYATSPNWGSHVAYSIKLGVPFFFLGQKPKYINVSHNKHPQGELTFADSQYNEKIEKSEELFSQILDTVTDEQKDFVDYHLGTTSSASRTDVTYIVWRELFWNYKLWPLFIFKPYAMRIIKRMLYFTR